MVPVYHAVRTLAIRKQKRSERFPSAYARQISAATLSHELTHFTQDFAEAEYAELRDFVVQTVMKKSPAEFHKLVLQQLRWEPNLSYDAAVDELVANGCMTMLQNTQAVKQIVREHLTLAERFGERLHEIGAKLKAAYEGIDVNEDAAIYHAAKLLSESHDEIQARWDKALAAATRNYNAEKTVERITGKPARPSTKVAVKARAEAKENAAPKGDVQFMSFDNTKNGLANDGLVPYDDELTGIITKRGDTIVNSLDVLREQVALAFREKGIKKTLYFGNIPYATLRRIENDVSNLPKRLNGRLFRVGRDYSLIATLDSIRHVNDDGNLSEDDVVSYMDRYADTVLDYDSVFYSEYTDNRGNKIDGLRFKKSYPDGTQVVYDIISNNKKGLALQTEFQGKKRSLLQPRSCKKPEHLHRQAV